MLSKINVPTNRSASLGELHGGHGAREASEGEEANLERSKSSRQLTKKKSFRFGSRDLLEAGNGEETIDEIGVKHGS